MRPFDNEGKRGGERRARDERVYTFVCIHQGIRQRLAGGKRVYGGPGRPSVGRTRWYCLGKDQDSGVINSYKYKRFSELGLRIGEPCEPAKES